MDERPRNLILNAFGFFLGFLAKSSNKGRLRVLVHQFGNFSAESSHMCRARPSVGIERFGDVLLERVSPTHGSQGDASDHCKCTNGSGHGLPYDEERDAKENRQDGNRSKKFVDNYPTARLRS